MSDHAEIVKTARRLLAGGPKRYKQEHLDLAVAAIDMAAEIERLKLLHIQLRALSQLPTPGEEGE